MAARKSVPDVDISCLYYPLFPAHHQLALPACSPRPQVGGAGRRAGRAHPDAGPYHSGSRLPAWPPKATAGCSLLHLGSQTLSGPFPPPISAFSLFSCHSPRKEEPTKASMSTGMVLVHSQPTEQAGRGRPHRVHLTVSHQQVYQPQGSSRLYRSLSCHFSWQAHHYSTSQAGAVPPALLPSSGTR